MPSQSSADTTRGTAQVVARPLIALISATAAAIDPAETAIVTTFGDVDVWNLLDDRLLVEADAAGGLTPALCDRMQRLIRHAETEGAAGVVLTCSMYGAVARNLDSSAMPVLPPDDAAFAAAIASGTESVLLLSSFESARADSSRRFTEAVERSGSSIRVASTVAEGAMAATKASDKDALLASLVAAYSAHPDEYGAVLLGQYSLAPVADRLSAALGRPVFSGPASAATLLRDRLSDGAAS